MSDFVIENGVLTRYNGPGGDVVIPESVTVIRDNSSCDCQTQPFTPRRFLCEVVRQRK